MHDLVIRDATIVDGTAGPTAHGDVAIDAGVITAVGDVDGRGHRERDAECLLLTPGWVDIHTHYDGQATWDPEMTPSSWHGVTTVVMGNCGVGFAPEMVFDLPAGGRRLIQRADGYRATVVAGQVTFEDGEPTGARPGTLVRF